MGLRPSLTRDVHQRFGQFPTLSTFAVRLKRRSKTSRAREFVKHHVARKYVYSLPCYSRESDALRHRETIRSKELFFSLRHLRSCARNQGHFNRFFFGRNIGQQCLSRCRQRAHNCKPLSRTYRCKKAALAPLAASLF